MVEQKMDGPSIRTYDETYNAADADLILVGTKRLSAGTEAEKSVETGLHVFKVHSKVLAMTSTFFKDMVDLTGGQAGGSPGDIAIATDAKLPEVEMEENAAVIDMLLAAAYQKPEPLVNLTTKQAWTFILEVWEAANKYGFPLLRVLCTTSLR